MTSEPGTATDARVLRSRTAVLRAATDLLVEGGPGAVTVDAIVARSGVAKSTIYRHWESRDDILVDVVGACVPQFRPPDPALGFEHGLRQLVAEVARNFNDPDWARVLPALLVLRTHQDGIADIEHKVEKRQDDALASVLDCGVAEGRLVATVDLDEAAAVLMGPLMLAHLAGKPPVDDVLCDRVVVAFLAAYGA